MGVFTGSEYNIIKKLPICLFISARVTNFAQTIALINGQNEKI
jgi:hypothetical protein